jgi:hypothetical protein
MSDQSRGRSATGRFAFARDAAITIVVLLLVFAAVDDITTDNATAFPVEYSMLLVSAAWLAFVTARLWRSNHRMLGGVSALALVASVWAQRAIRPGNTPDLWPEYIVMMAVYVWFWALAIGLFWLGRRERIPHRGAIV